MAFTMESRRLGSSRLQVVLGSAGRLQSGSAVPAWEEPEGRVSETERDYTAFFRAEFAGVLRTISLMLRDRARAEEITQDAFIQLLKNWQKVSVYEQPESWVRRVAIRLAMRVIRRDRIWALVRQRLPAVGPTAAPSIDVADAIDRLSSTQRAAVILRYYEDRPVAEIATILGCAEPTARVHLHRARNRLRELLGEADDVS
jgi:DNA-directed RNA polymerase specialized sigma24 family protein